MERLLLVSSDDHAGASSAVYRQFLDGDFLDDFDRWLQAQRDRQGLKGMLENASQEVVAMLERNSSEERAIFGTDLSKRLERLEREGIVAEVLFPEPAVGPTHGDFGVPFANLFAGAGDESLDLLAAGYRAHNRWLAETADHQRQAGLALIALHDVDAAAREIREAGRSGLRGIALDGIHPDLPPLDDSVYEALWSACESEDLPVHFHTGNGGLGATRARGPRSDGKPVPHLDPVRMTEAGFFSQRPLTFLILGGVCHRHPNLRVVFSEMGAKWAADKVKELDRSWATFGDRHVCPEPPSHYYQRQVFFGLSSPSLREIEVRHEVGIDKIMWGSDHPHGNSGWDRTHVWLRSTLGQAGVTEPEARAMLGESAARFYGFDVDDLKVHAQRVGPTTSDVLRPADPGELDEDEMLRWMLWRDVDQQTASAPPRRDLG